MRELGVWGIYCVCRQAGRKRRNTSDNKHQEEQQDSQEPPKRKTGSNESSEAHRPSSQKKRKVYDSFAIDNNSISTQTGGKKIDITPHLSSEQTSFYTLSFPPSTN